MTGSWWWWWVFSPLHFCVFPGEGKSHLFSHAKLRNGKSREFKAAPSVGLALWRVCSARGQDSFPFFRSCSIPNSCFLKLMPSRCKIPSERDFPQWQMDRRGNGIRGNSEGHPQSAHRARWVARWEGLVWTLKLGGAGFPVCEPGLIPMWWCF